MSIRVMYPKYKDSFISVYFPSRENIENLKVGDMAPDPFGKESRVTRIYSQGKLTKNNLAFVLYYVEFGPHSEMSMDMVEDTIPRTVDLSAKLKSAEIDKMEDELRGTKVFGKVRP